jgi:hypothetical protein
VLVWERSARALRDPEGHVFYSEDSALHQGDSDIGGAVFLPGAALLMMVGVFAVSPWFQRRSPRYMPLAIVLTDAGISGAVGGAVIQGSLPMAEEQIRPWAMTSPRRSRWGICFVLGIRNFDRIGHTREHGGQARGPPR